MICQNEGKYFVVVVVVVKKKVLKVEWDGSVVKVLF